jgi:hypothetical protein
MTKMDEEQVPECDVYVEDERAKVLVQQAISTLQRDVLLRVQVVPFGSAQVGKALGLMNHQNRFPRPSVVFLDGDQDSAEGCLLLPGEDAPERVVFSHLHEQNWDGVASLINRRPAETIDALNATYTIGNHKEWINAAADRLVLGGDILWNAMCIRWAATVDESVLHTILDPIQAKLLPT